MFVDTVWEQKHGTMAVTKLESLPRVVLKRIGNLGTQKREGLGGVVEDLAVVLVRISVMRIKVSLLRCVYMCEEWMRGGESGERGG